jgi:hypothetical protein
MTLIWYGGGGRCSQGHMTGLVIREEWNGKERISLSTDITIAKIKVTWEKWSEYITVWLYIKTNISFSLSLANFVLCSAFTHHHELRSRKYQGKKYICIISRCICVEINKENTAGFRVLIFSVRTEKDEAKNLNFQWEESCSSNSINPNFQACKVMPGEGP